MRPRGWLMKCVDVESRSEFGCKSSTAIIEATMKAGKNNEFYHSIITDT